MCKIYQMQVTSGAGQSSHFDSSWTRLRAEVQFAQGNLSAALVHYLESVVAQTEYFSKAAFQVGKTTFEFEFGG